MEQLWGNGFQSLYEDVYDASREPTSAGAEAACPGWRYLLSLPRCPRQLHLPMRAKPGSTATPIDEAPPNLPGVAAFKSRMDYEDWHEAWWRQHDMESSGELFRSHDPHEGGRRERVAYVSASEPPQVWSRGPRTDAVPECRLRWKLVGPPGCGEWQRMPATCDHCGAALGSCNC